MKRNILNLFIGAFLFGSFSQRGQAAAPITSIVFEEHGCFGNCPVFKVTLNSSGKGTYEGLKFTPRLGKFDGDFSAEDFSRLTRIFEKLELEHQSISTRMVADDLESTIIVNRGQSVWKLHFPSTLESAELWGSRIILEQFLENKVMWRKLTNQ